MISRTLVYVALAGVVLGGAWMLGGCEKKQPTPTMPPKPSVSVVPAAAEPNKAAVSEATEQTTCPVMGSPIDKKIFVEYKGKKVYFCCSMCPPEFQKNPDKYISKLPQFKNP